MSEFVRADGAPVEQGRAQGEFARAAIRADLARRARETPWLARRALARRAAASFGRALATQLPWQRERIEGLAQAARVSERALLLAEAQTRVQGAAFADGSRLAAAFALAPELESLVVARRSAPDAGGFASAELALAPLAGCVCGVNEAGIGAVVVRDGAPDEPSLRFFAQELLFRARDLAAGIDHLRRRAAYAGGTGALVAADAGGAVVRLELAHGALAVVQSPPLPRSAAAPDVLFDLAARRLTWRGAAGAAAPVRLEATAR